MAQYQSIPMPSPWDRQWLARVALDSWIDRACRGGLPADDVSYQATGSNHAAAKTLPETDGRRGVREAGTGDGAKRRRAFSPLLVRYTKKPDSRLRPPSRTAQP
ncbi:hypothetical protein V2G26_006303 [Clonostachys chloroleuca]